MHTNVEFLVVAEAYPGLLNRLLEPFAKRDLTPDTLQARRDGTTMHVRLGMHAMPSEMVHLVEGNISQVIGVLRIDRREGLRLAA